MQADIIAHVRFYPTAHGGRQGPTPKGAFGCLLELHGDCFDCRLLLTETGPLSPGQQADVPIKFLNFDLVKDQLVPGKKFFLRERQIIAEGEVAKILAAPVELRSQET